MAQPSSRQNPTFFWQGLLILLPLGLLAALGFLSVRQDRLVAEHEAVRRAQNIADELLPRVSAELSETNHSQATFETDAAGRLLLPPPSPSTLVPVTFEPSSLSPSQRRVWLDARSAEVSGQDAAPAARAYRDFLAANPPTNFAALAQYSLGLLLAKGGDTEAARACFDGVWKNFPEAIGESGLALAPLAGFKRLELETRVGPATDSSHVEAIKLLGSNLVWQPTPLSSELLARSSELALTPEARAAAADWERTWSGHERSRDLFAAWTSACAKRGDDRPPPRALWFTASETLPTRQPERKPGTATLDNTISLDRLKRRYVSAAFPVASAVPEQEQSWLGVWGERTPTNYWCVCWPESEIGARLTSVVGEARQIPEYFGVGIEVAGKRLTWPAPDLRMWEYENYFGRAGGGQKKVFLPELSTNVLASAALNGKAGLVKVSVYLTSRGALLAREQARSFWLAALVAAAAFAAGVGFIKAYRAFERQLRLSELKSNFVSSVSHELRAPIASVRLMAESLERGKVTEPERRQEYFKFIVQECRRLSSLVENVLDFSRIEQGRKQYDFEPTDLYALAQQTVKLLEPYAAERQVNLELRTETARSGIANLQLNADGKALQQALVNLVDNAIKHSPKGQTVTVGLERRTGVLPVHDLPGPATAGGNDSQTAGSAVLLWVEDHGEGIPGSEHEKIFERFYRRGSELRRETQGVGIGLSIVKHIVEAHGGRVELSSEIGKGSRFTIVLPIS
ncbi:MAG TPA: ATP-binding protein [Verrucomicrobiae bacterium]